MTFLNFALIGGVLAFNVPLLIHLLSKSRYQQVDWGAMFLLEQVVRQNRRRLKLEQLILLLVRCAIPVLLALAFAQPILSGFRNLVGDQPGSAMVLLDSSYSMQARTEAEGADGQTRFAVAQKEIQAILDAMPHGSEANVAQIGGGYRPVVATLTSQRDRLAGQVNELDAELPFADGHDALRRGVEAINNADQPKRDVLLISDFQRNSWSRDSGSERKRLVELIESMPIKPKLTLIPVGEEVSRNAAVMDVSLSVDAVGIGRPFRVRALVSNTGMLDLTDVPVMLLADGVEVDRQRLSLVAGGSGDVLFNHKFEDGGGHTLEIKLGPDDLPADDVYRVAINVLDSLPVVLVSSEAGKPFPQNETDFLEVALQPFAAATNAPLADLIKVSTIHPDKLDQQTLDGSSVVVLANVARLGDPQLTQLRGFVEAGGGLIVLPGDRIDTDWYNRDLYKAGDGLLPAKITGLAGVDLGFSSPAKIRSQRHEHPALALWNDPANGSLDAAEFTAWYQLQPSMRASVIADLTVGSPALIEQTIGEGLVILAAIPADTDWGDLPTRPIFLPLVQRLVTHAATHAVPPRNVEVGSPMIARLNPMPVDEDEDGKKKNPPKTATWTNPAGERIAQPIVDHQGQLTTELLASDRPGFFRLKQPDGSVDVFAANLPRGESNLDRLSAEEIAELATGIGATVAEDAQAFIEQDDLARNGRPIWKLVWVAALVLVFGELVLQQWFGKGGRA